MHHYDMYHNQRSLSQRLIFNFQLVSAHKSVGISYVRFDRCGIFKIPPEFQWELLSNEPRITITNNQWSTSVLWLRTSPTKTNFSKLT
jgi:hypothetical protein